MITNIKSTMIMNIRSTRIFGGKCFDAKLGNMRKAQTFLVYEQGADNTYIRCQADRWLVIQKDGGFLMTSKNDVHANSVKLQAELIKGTAIKGELDPVSMEQLKQFF